MDASAIIKELTDAAQLMIVKAAVEAIAGTAKELIKTQLKEMGIEADIQIDVKTISVNLETLAEARKRRK